MSVFMYEGRAALQRRVPEKVSSYHEKVPSYIVILSGAKSAAGGRAQSKACPEPAEGDPYSRNQSQPEPHTTPPLLSS